MGRIYQTSIAIAATIAKAFKSDTYDAAKAVTKLGEAMKKLKAAEKSAASLKKLDDELARSKGRYNTATEALRRLKDAENAAGGATKESLKWRRAGERAVTQAARAVDRATKSAQKHSEVLHALGIDTSKLASEQGRLARALAATERQEKALGRYEASRERLFGARSKTPLMQKAGGQIRGIASDAMFLGTAAAGAGAALAGLVVHAIHTGDEIGDTADKLGIAGAALQELRYGARQSGAEVEDLDRAIAKMAISIGKHKLAKGKAGAGGAAIPGLQLFNIPTAAGAGAVVDPFKQIGLKAKELAQLKPEEQIKKIAEGMKTLKTHADRAAVAQLIFGKGATAILPFLAEGAAGIDKLSQNAHKYGGVLTDEQLAAADAADKAMKDAELAVSGLTATLTADLLPVATDVFKRFSGWVASNRGEIKKWSENAARWITGKGIPAIVRIATEVTALAAKVAHLIEVGARLTGGFGNLAIVVGALRLAPLAVTLGKIGIEGTKAAIAVYKYVAAKKAAAALGGGIDGMGPGAASAWAKAGGAVGVAASAAMVAGAAAVGFAIGTYLDNKFHISDDAEKAVHILGSNDEDLNEGERAAKHSAWDIFKGSIFGGGQGAVDAAARAQAEFTKKKASEIAGHGGGGSHSNVFHIHEVSSREDLSKGIDKAKTKALEDYDKREAHRRRVSFAR